MKTKIMITIIIACLGGISFAQAIFNTTQSKINNDQASISLDLIDIAAKNAEIQSLQSDPAYNEAQAETVNNAVVNQVNMMDQVNEVGP